MAMMVFLASLLPAVLSDECGQDRMDCSDLYISGETVSGIYSIYPAGEDPVSVYCEMISDGNNDDNGGWTVIQRRMDGSVNFYQPWNQYKRGFGKVESEYWLGLENMYQLTLNRNYMLRVDLEDFTGSKVFAQYSSFSVDSEDHGYKLHVSGYASGVAGDSLHDHNDKKFTTLDNDQDSNHDHNCAKLQLGAFWYKDCGGVYTNPNGVYTWGQYDAYAGIGNVWSTWKGNNVGLKSISMKIKRVS